MDQQTYRKFLLSKIDCAQREVELFKGLLTEITTVETAAAPAVAEEATTTKKTAAKKAAPKVEATPEVETTSDDDLFGTDEETKEVEITLADVRQAVKNFATKHGKEKTLKFLAKWKVTAIPDLKKTDYAQVVELAQKHS
jgi:hypothetical protein